MNCTTQKPAEKKVEAHVRRPWFRSAASENGYTLDVWMPEVKTGQVKMQTHQGLLVIEAPRTWKPEADWKVLHRETWGDSYKLEVNLPRDIEPDGIKAKLADGILHVQLPRAESFKPRQIAISN